MTLLSRLASDYPFMAKDLAILSNPDPEKDFFMCMCHIQVHKQRAAVAQFEEVAANKQIASVFYCLCCMSFNYYGCYNE